MWNYPDGMSRSDLIATGELDAKHDEIERIYEGLCDKDESGDDSDEHLMTLYEKAEQIYAERRGERLYGHLL